MGDKQPEYRFETAEGPGGTTLLKIFDGTRGVSQVQFKADGGVCEVRGLISHVGRKDVQFKREFGVSPAVYLLEELVRRGFTRFDFSPITRESQGLVKKLVQEKIISGRDTGLNSRFAATSEGLQRARSRKHRLPR